MKKLITAAIILATLAGAAYAGSECIRLSDGRRCCMVCDDQYTGRGCRYICD